MSNMKVWDRLRQPPLSVLKPITAGRLKGKTDISPQWRLQAMTEQFGPCGVGWYYDIEKLWTEDANDGQKFAFAQVKLYYKEGNEWSKGIPGIGGSMAIDLESKGLYASDECYKMAVTDALGVAMKSIGMAADIYLGLFDGSKYKTAPSNPLVDYMKDVARLFASIAMIKNGIATNNLAMAAEAWFELDKPDKEALWKAPTDGGIFTTAERDVIKSTEFRQAYYPEGGTE